MSRHIIALQIFAGFVQEFASADINLATQLDSINRIQNVELQFDCVDYALLRVQHLISEISF